MSLQGLAIDIASGEREARASAELALQWHITQLVVDMAPLPLANHDVLQKLAYKVHDRVIHNADTLGQLSEADCQRWLVDKIWHELVGELLPLYRDQVLAQYARSFGPPLPVSFDDAWQHTCAVVLRKKYDWRDEKQFIGLLVRIGSRFIQDKLREARRKAVWGTGSNQSGEMLGAVQVAASPGASPSRAARRSERGQIVRDALKRCDSLTALLLLAHFEEGLSYLEIGEKYGLSVAATKMRVHRALKKLAGLLDESLLSSHS